MRAWFERRYPKAPAIPTRCIDRRFAPRRWTRCAGCCRPRRSRTSGSTAPARPTNRCCCACARIRSPKSAHAADRDARGAAQSHPGVSAARRSAGARRPMERVSGGDAPADHGNGPRGCHGRGEPRDEVTLTDFDPDGEVKVVAAALYAVDRRCPDDELMARARRHERRRTRRRAARLRRRADEPPPQARPRLRADQLSLRRPHRLRRVSRSAAAPPADDRLAAAHDRATATSQPEAVVEAGGDADWRRVMERSAELHDALVAPASASSRSTPCRWPIASGSSWT